MRKEISFIMINSIFCGVGLTLFLIKPDIFFAIVSLGGLLGSVVISNNLISEHKRNLKK